MFAFQVLDYTSISAAGIALTPFNFIRLHQLQPDNVIHEPGNSKASHTNSETSHTKALKNIITLISNAVGVSFEFTYVGEYSAVVRLAESAFGSHANFKHCLHFV